MGKGVRTARVLEIIALKDEDLLCIVEGCGLQNFFKLAGSTLRETQARLRTAGSQGTPVAPLVLPYFLFGWRFRWFAFGARCAGSACTACTACTACIASATRASSRTGCTRRAGGARLGDHCFFAGGEAKRHDDCGGEQCVFHGNPLSKWVCTGSAKVCTDARLTAPHQQNCRTDAPAAVPLIPFPTAIRD